MMVKAEQDDLKRVLIATISSVCRERLQSTTGHFGIEGLLAITLQEDQVLLVNVNENIICSSTPQLQNAVGAVSNTTQSTAGAASLALSPVANGRAMAEGSPKVQVNGNSSVLCSIVSKAPLVVAPFQIPAQKGITTSTPKAAAALLQTTQGQTLTLDAAKHLKFSNDQATAAQTFTIDATTKNVRLGEIISTTTTSGSSNKHKGPFTSSPQEPPQKKRLLEEHLTSNLPVVSSHQQQMQQQQQQPQQNNTGVISLLDNIVIKKEVLSDDEDFPPGEEGSLAESCSSHALGLDIDHVDLVGGAGGTSGSAHNGLSSAAELKKMVRSDKMWNQHPVAQLSVTQLTTVTQGSSSTINLGSINSNSNNSSSTIAMYANSLPGQQDAFGYNGVSIKEEDDEDTSSYLSGNSTLEDPICDPETDEEEFLKLARSILLYKGTFITVHSFCKVSRRTGKNAMTKISSERACWVMQKMNVPAWDEKYIGEYKELRKGTKVFFKCPPDMVNPKALAYYNVPLKTYGEGYYEESRSASFPTKTELLKRILDASPY